jgi:hypothetical protein
MNDTNWPALAKQLAEALEAVESEGVNCSCDLVGPCGCGYRCGNIAYAPLAAYRAATAVAAAEFRSEWRRQRRIDMEPSDG